MNNNLTITLNFVTPQPKKLAMATMSHYTPKLLSFDELQEKLRGP